MKRIEAGLVAAALLGLSAPACATAADLYQFGAWPALAGDRAAARVGDTLTVIIDENSIASNSAQNGSRKTSHFGGQLSAGSAFNKAGSLDLSSGFDGSGQTARTHKMLAQISVVVDQVLANGDLHVAGVQALKINGERTNIHLKGRVRPQDIASDNTVLSTRLADATIDYDGAGFVAGAVKPGILTRLFNWVGLP
ncbi:MAG: flagellar basal body L-ring protein FlgH [Caulobacterales bacterium]